MLSLTGGPCDRGVILSHEATMACERARGRWVLVATILASSMAFIDGTVVNVALPSLQRNLNATAVDVQWVVESYALLLSALLLVGGSLGDRYGRRTIFVIGVTLFAVASAACGFATGIVQLILARAVQGIGGALLVPGSLAIISASFKREDRGKAIGTWSGFSAMTTAIGPVMGGWLVEHVSWRAVFFLNIPIALAVIVISLARVPESRDSSNRGSLDWLGAALATIGLGGVVYGLIESSRLGFGNAMVLASLIGGSLALVLFVINEMRTRNPMMPLDLFRSSAFAGANLLTLLLYAALGGTLFFLTLNLIQAQGFSATAAGASLLPLIVIMFALSRWSGGLVGKFGARVPLIVGPLIAGFGFALLAVPGTNANYWTGFFPAVAVLGLGMAISVAPLTTTVMTAAGEEQSGVASGINNAVSRTAGLLAIAVFGVVMLHTFSRTLERKLNEIQLVESERQQLLDQKTRLAGIEVSESLEPDKRRQIQDIIENAFVAGFRVNMLTSAGLAVCGALTSWLLIGASGATKSSQNADQPDKEKAKDPDRKAQYINQGRLNYFW